MNVRHPMGVLNSFSTKTIFYDKIDLRPFFDVIYSFRMREVPIWGLLFALNIRFLRGASVLDISV